MGIEGVLNKGFVTTSADTVLNYVRTGSPLAGYVRLGLLRGGNDAGGRGALRTSTASALSSALAAPV